MQSHLPSFLKGYESIYREDPRKATLAWFKNQRLGLFIHYGLYSLEGRGEWLMYSGKIRPLEYRKLAERFTAERFDVDFITDLAIEAGMGYINLVTKHCDSFCLWDTKQTDFNSVNSPAGKDLVREMAEACDRKGLGLFVFYEHGFDWMHPHGPAPWEWPLKVVRPPYETPDPWYADPDDYDFQLYLDYAREQIKELLTGYGPVAGVWLDGASIPLSGDPDKFQVKELYAMIRELQPQALISYKWGVTGDEDFFAPERHQVKFIENRTAKLTEVCRTLQKNVTPIGREDGSKEWGAPWGYIKDEHCAHCTIDDVWKMVEEAAEMGANLCLNTGPLPDGSIHPADVEVLKALGERIRTSGLPPLKIER